MHFKIRDVKTYNRGVVSFFPVLMGKLPDINNKRAFFVGLGFSVDYYLLWTIILLCFGDLTNTF